jgi:tRNA pseudouridine55 synthase
VLVIGVGRAATRQLRWIAATEKEYITRVKLGWRSTTEDREGKIEQVFWTTEDRRQTTEDGGRKAASSGQIPSEEQVQQALAHFQGTINQRPPAFSAVKVRGRPAYELARKGRDLDLPPRVVEVKEIALVAYAWPYADVRLVTSPGFYVRSFARDLGELLGTGAYMEQLERIRVGTHTKERAVRLADFARSIQEASRGDSTA